MVIIAKTGTESLNFVCSELNSSRFCQLYLVRLRGVGSRRRFLSPLLCRFPNELIENRSALPTADGLKQNVMFREVLMAMQVERIKKGQRIYEPLAPALHLMGTNQDGKEAVGVK
jgi:hypothetical protein